MKNNKIRMGVWLLMLIQIIPFANITGQNLLSNGSFEQDYSNWNNRAIDGAVTVFSISEDAISGSQSAKVEVNELGANPWSIQTLHTRNWTIELGKLYKISFSAKGSNPNLTMKMVHAEGNFQATNLTLSQNWELFEYLYEPTVTNPDLKIQYLDEGIYFIDNIIVEEQDVNLPVSGSRTLKDLAEGCNLPIGAAVANNVIGTGNIEYEEILSLEYNMLVGENAHKTSSIIPVNASPSFVQALPIENFARENNQALRGHAILWHRSIPNWVTDKTWTKPELWAFLKTYVYEVVGRTKGLITEWDIANEFVQNEAPYGLRYGESFWLDELGEACLDSTFVWAHDADPDAKLFYNDFFAETMNPKSDAVLDLVRKLKARGVPIDGVGLQMHAQYDIATSMFSSFIRGMDENIKRISAAGFDVAITEIDLGIRKPVTPNKLFMQAMSYQNILQVVLNNKTDITAFVSWGFTDNYTSVKGDFDAGLPFDRDYKRKPAYHALYNTLEKGCEILLETKEPFSGTPISIPGTIEAEEYDKGGQMISYNDIDAANNGNEFRTDGVDIAKKSGIDNYVIGWVARDEWLEYTVQVGAAIDYDFIFHTSSLNGNGKISILLDGDEILGLTEVPATNGWGDYQTFSRQLALPSGRHILRLKMEAGGFNLDKIEVRESVISNTTELSDIEQFSVFPNPSNSGHFQLVKEMDWEVYSVKGLFLDSGKGRYIDLSEQEKGVYFLKANNFTKKIIIK